MKLTSRARGFTLLEVLIALAILAIALGAVVKAAAESAVAAGYLRDRTLASWVALNRINEVMLERGWVEPGGSQGEIDMAGRTWRWDLRVSNTTDPDLRRLDMTVRPRGEETTSALLIAFKKRPRA